MTPPPHVGVAGVVGIEPPAAEEVLAGVDDLAQSHVTAAATDPEQGGRVYAATENEIFWGGNSCAAAGSDLTHDTDQRTV